VDVTIGSEYEVAGISTDYFCTVYSLSAISDTVQRTSFMSYYWTHPQEVRQGFHVRWLHTATNNCSICVACY